MGLSLSSWDLNLSPHLLLYDPTNWHILDLQTDSCFRHKQPAPKTFRKNKQNPDSFLIFSVLVNRFNTVPYWLCSSHMRYKQWWKWWIPFIFEVGWISETAFQLFWGHIHMKIKIESGSVSLKMIKSSVHFPSVCISISHILYVTSLVLARCVILWCYVELQGCLNFILPSNLFCLFDFSLLILIKFFNIGNSWV